MPSDHLQPIRVRATVTLAAVAVSLLAIAGCAPPWYGEECNYHVAVVSFLDQDSRHIPLDSLGYTEVRELERDRLIDQDAWADIDEMQFRSHSPETEFLLPLDPEVPQSTFVFQHAGGNDTLALRYLSKLKRYNDGCGLTFDLYALSYSFNGGPIINVDFTRHPRIVGEVEVQR
jgi:hypothetical protein